MALQGSLNDLHIVELIQVPAAGRKTGELFIAGLEGIARLFYSEGKLVHLETDELQGQEALVDILGWTEGEFEFRPDSEPGARTFEMDLHKALMLALKLRDERAAESTVSEADESRVRELLGAFVAANDFVRVCCASRGGRCIVACGPRQPGEPPWLGDLQVSIGALFERYPRKSLQRVLFEDVDGTVVVTRTAGGSILMAVAERNATLGAVSVAVDRLARRLEELGEPDRT